MTFWSWIFSKNSPFWVRAFFSVGIGMLILVFAGVSVAVDWRIGVLGMVLLSTSMVIVSLREWRRHIVKSVFNEVSGDSRR